MVWNWAAKSFEALIVRQVDQQLLILDKVARRIHHLNHSASFVWRRWHDGLAPTVIASELAQEYAVDHRQALIDVHAALRSLESLNLLCERRKPCAALPVS
jgi:hypothetical protein